MKIRIVSSTSETFKSENIDEVYMPSLNGNIGILKKHENLITALDIGVVRVKKDGEEKKLFINGGIAQIMDDEILVLADEAELPEEIIQEEIEKAIRDAEKEISSSKLDPTELIQLEKKLRYEKFKKEQI